MAAIFQAEVFWDPMPCSIVVGYQHFRGPCCLSIRFSVNAWCGASGKQFIGKLIFNDHLTDDIYASLFAECIAPPFTCCSDTQLHMYLQHDEAHSHSSRQLMQYVNLYLH